MTAKPVLEPLRRALAALTLLCCAWGSAQAAATIVIDNRNAPGVGFNDPTPVAPVGGNPGTTLGAQRLIAFQTAANIWGNNITSTVPIRIAATFEPLDRSDIEATLFARRARHAPVRNGELLLQLRPDGRPGVWRRGQRILTYAIDCSTFASAQQCALADQALAAAIRDWQNACANCGVRFRKVAATPASSFATTPPPMIIWRLPSSPTIPHTSDIWASARVTSRQATTARASCDMSWGMCSGIATSTTARRADAIMRTMIGLR